MATKSENKERASFAFFLPAKPIASGWDTFFIWVLFEKPYCGARIPQPVNKHLDAGRRINFFIRQSSCCQLHISVPASDKVTSPIKMNTHASAFLLGCGCLLPCAKVPAPGRRFDIVPDVVPQVLKTRHSLGPPNLSACFTIGLRHLANSSQDGFRTWQLTPIKKKTSGPETQVPEPLCSHTCRICRRPRRDTMAVWQQVHVWDVVDRQLSYSCIKHGSKNDQNAFKKMMSRL